MATRAQKDANIRYKKKAMKFYTIMVNKKKYPGLIDWLASLVDDENASINSYVIGLIANDMVKRGIDPAKPMEEAMVDESTGGPAVDDKQVEWSAYAVWESRCGFHHLVDSYEDAYADFQKAKRNTLLMNERKPQDAPHECRLYCVDYLLHEDGSIEILHEETLAESDGETERYL